MARLWLSTGVLRGELSELATFADSTGMQVKVPSGTAWNEGQLFINDATVTLPIATANGSNPRIDRVVVRKDTVGKSFSLEVLTGTAGASPSAPALTQNASIWELPLAQVLVPAAATTITSGNVTDERFIVRNVDLSSVQALANKTLTNPVVNGSLTGTAVGTGSNQVAAGNHAHAPSKPTTQFTAGAWGIPASGGPTYVPISSGEAELQFAAGQFVSQIMSVPSLYTGTTVTVRLHWYTPSGSQTVAWTFNFVAISPGGAAYTAAANVANVSTVSSGANTETVSVMTFALDPSNAGRSCRIQVTRANSGTAQAASLTNAEIVWG